MQNMINAELLYSVDNVINWEKQGTAFYVSGSFTTTPGAVTQQLLPSTNTALGYFNGQMLAYAAGDGTGDFAGLTAGAFVNWDPLSTDTGQAVWNKFIIADPDMHAPLDLNTTYVGTLRVATAFQGWVLRQQYCYGGKTPALDIAAVNTAVKAAGVIQSRVQNQSQAYEVVFAY